MSSFYFQIGRLMPDGAGWNATLEKSCSRVSRFFIHDQSKACIAYISWRFSNFVDFNWTWEPNKAGEKYARKHRADSAIIYLKIANPPLGRAPLSAFHVFNFNDSISCRESRRVLCARNLEIPTPRWRERVAFLNRWREQAARRGVRRFSRDPRTLLVRCYFYAESPTEMGKSAVILLAQPSPMDLNSYLRGVLRFSVSFLKTDSLLRSLKPMSLFFSSEMKAKKRTA